jgi:hypothetical protein
MYRLCLTLSHQCIEQLSLPVRQAIFGNVGTHVAFRVGNTDAEVLGGEFGKEFDPQQLVDLDRFELVVKLLENGTNATPFRARRRPPARPTCRRVQGLVRRFRERFAMSREELELRLRRWMEPESF